MVRMDWIDCAKALSIILVVLLHASYYLERLDLLHWLYYELNAVLEPLRMPVFFSISGFLAANAISKSWSTILRQKSFLYIYILIIWLSIDWLIQYIVISADLESYFIFILHQLIYPKLHYWFIYALAIYFPLTKLFSNQFNYLVLAIAALLFVIIKSYPQLIDNFAHRSIITYFFFFYLGYVMKDSFYVLAKSFSLKRLAMITIVYIAVYIIGKNLPIEGNIFVGILGIVMSLLGLIVGIFIAVCISKVPFIANMMIYIGKNTLGIYLIHTFYWYSIFTVLVYLQLDKLSPLLPILITIIAIIFSLITKKITDILKMGWLYRPLFQN